MKRAPLLVLAGTAAGFIGVLSFHTRPATLTLPAAGPSPSPSRTPAATAGNRGVAGPGAVRSATGAAEQFGYGVLDVKVTVSGTRITDVSVPTLEVAEYTSQQICDQAIPLQVRPARIRKTLFSSSCLVSAGLVGLCAAREYFILS